VELETWQLKMHFQDSSDFFHHKLEQLLNSNLEKILPLFFQLHQYQPIVEIKLPD